VNFQQPIRLALYDKDQALIASPSIGTITQGKAISYLTLYGAYAATVFWVISHYLNNVGRCACSA
jgi:hypothetical protein